MPFPEHGCFISGGLEHITHGGVFRIEATRPRSMRAKHFCPAGIASAKKGRTGCRADHLRHIEIVERAATRGHSLDIGGGVIGLTEGPEISPSRIVEKDDDEVRTLVFTAMPRDRPDKAKPAAPRPDLLKNCLRLGPIFI